MRPVFALLAFTVSCLALTPEQETLPREVEPTDSKLAKVVLIAGVPSNKPGQHEYFAGCALMMHWLKAEKGVWPVLVADGWPKNEAVLDGAKAIVVYADGGPKLPFIAPERWDRMKRVVEGGAGFVMLHQAVDVPAAQAEGIRQWLGGVWQADIGSRGHWDMEFSKWPQHPIMRGVTPFAAPLDGWLFNLHFAEKGVTPLLAAPVPDKSRTTADAKANVGRDEVMAWAYERPGGERAFSFTGCDLHRNWGVESQRRFVVNGILWAAGLEVPESGSTVKLDPTDLTRWMDKKAAGGPAPVPAQAQ